MTEPIVPFSLLTLAAPPATAPVRLVTGDESATPLSSAPTSPSATGPAAFVAMGLGLCIILAISSVHARRWWSARTGSNLDHAAAHALARRLGLSRRQRETLERVAQADPNVTTLDLLVSVKKFTVAAARHASSGLTPIEKQALIDLGRAIGAADAASLSDPPAPSATPPSSGAPTQASSAQLAKTSQRPASSKPSGNVKSVVSPRLIDRRG